MGGPSSSLHSHSPSLHVHSSSPQTPSPSEKWRRYAETEVNRERRRVDKTCWCHPDACKICESWKRWLRAGWNDRGHLERWRKCRQSYVLFLCIPCSEQLRFNALQCNCGRALCKATSVTIGRRSFAPAVSASMPIPQPSTVILSTER